VPRRRALLAEGPGSVFGGVPPEELEPFLSGLKRQRFSAGSVILEAGERPPAVFVVESGEAEIVHVSRTGVELVIGHVAAGGTFGEMSLLTGDPAAAAVRATEDVEAIAIGKNEFERIAARFPVVYRNVGELLAERLAEAVALTAGEKRGRIALLRQCGAPPLLAYAISCSVGWHTQVPVLLLLVEGGEGEELDRLAGVTGGAVEVARVTGDPEYGPDRLEATLEAHAERFAHVLAVVGRDTSAGNRPAIDLLPAGAPPPLGSSAHLAVRAWSASRSWAPRPWGGVLDVPVLQDADEQALAAGRLPSRTPAGKAVGWLARYLAGLQVGVAMGTGSLRGFAHYGVLSVLERNHIDLDYIAGTSIGAASAGTTAYGYDAEAGAQHMFEVARSVFRPTVPAFSLLTNAGVGRYLHQIFGDARMEDLALPCAIVAADLAAGRKVVLRRGPLWRAVLDSMAIPGLYPAHRVDRTVLVDGGLIDPVPTAVCADMGADVVVSVRLTGNPVEPLNGAEASLVQHRPPSMIRVILDSIELMQSEVDGEPTQTTSILLTPDCPPIKGRLRNFGEGRRYVESGVEAAEAAMPRIAAALPWLRPGAD
jgi:NTE family protein